MDGRTPEQIDRVLGLWQRLLSGLGCRYAPVTSTCSGVRRTAPETTVGRRVARTSHPFRPGSASEFLAERIQRLDAYVVWSLRLRACARPPGGRSRAGTGVCRLKGVGGSAAARARNDLPGLGDRGGGRTVPGDDRRGPLRSSRSTRRVELLGCARTHPALLSELTINRPGTFWDGATGSGMNWRLAVSELEAERSHLRLDGEPVIRLLAPVAARPGAREPAQGPLLPGRRNDRLARMAAVDGRGVAATDPERAAPLLLAAATR